MLKALIVEDEYLAREELQYLISTHSQIDVVASFDDGLEAFKYLQSHKVDIVFLDINIPSIDGMLLARNIHQFQHKPHIVFTTAYKEYAVDAFELEAFDYLLKPISETRVKGLLQKLESINNDIPVANEKVTTSLNLTRDNRIYVTPIKDIYYAVAKEKITEVCTASGLYIVPYTISDLRTRLPQDQFYRSHRSYIVNTSKICEIIPWVNSTYLLKLRDVEGEIPVSRSNIKTFRQLMNL
ncbi:DNA-binding response regulator [Photobacterium damselae subsp. damselae]|uniref:LytR/AlgR family response regulator transcription factor n=1 Tax=Photobacterium damselae TaxID=38293 RepID=UPI00084A6813|nr:LytTR family DNA-binding domain-containing protein [Photobacterium damselae]OEC84138.1 DNA-binding response regulator [Photobacterium damselae subsp. damselae]